MRNGGLLFTESPHETTVAALPHQYFYAAWNMSTEGTVRGREGANWSGALEMHGPVVAKSPGVLVQRWRVPH